MATSSQETANSPFAKALVAANFLKDDSKKTGVVLLSTDESLEIYSCYKQATVGDINVAKPGFFDFVGKYKYSAWQKLKGMSQEQAKKQYCEVVKKYMIKYGFSKHAEGF